MLCLPVIAQAQSPFLGPSGVYYLGAADIPIPTQKFANPNISGVVCRFRWATVEPLPGRFNWSFVDGEIAKARQAGKKISLQPLGYPAWIVDSLHATAYYSIDENRFHSTFGMIQRGVMTWDGVYLERVRVLLRELASKYANDSTVACINAIGGQISRNMPDSVVTDTARRTLAPFWTTFAYHADTVAARMYPIIDEYMTLFPRTPLWCSVDYVRFEQRSSGGAPNYLASLYTAYAFARYPDRFGFWREDISGCTPFDNVNPGSQWRIMKDNPCRTGAQMLWSVQDGPSRMNQCGLAPNTKPAVLRAAVENGLRFGMRYIEIYGADIDDVELRETIAWADSALRDQGRLCIASTHVETEHSATEALTVFPNPSSGRMTINSPDQEWRIVVLDLLGRPVASATVPRGLGMLDCSALQSGMYLAVAQSSVGAVTLRVLIAR